MGTTIIGTSTLNIIVAMIVYVILLTIIHEFSRRYLKATTIFYFLALASFPLWFYSIDGWFRWGKTLLVLIPICFANLLRLSNQLKGDRLAFFSKNWIYWFLYIALFLNIAEPSTKDLLLGNYCNAIAGYLLCITIPLPHKAWKIDKTFNSFNDLVVDLPIAWCLLYSTWCCCFVYAENPGFLAGTICTILVPAIRMFYKGRRDLWLSARIYTLSFHILIRATYDVFQITMNSSSWANQKVLYFWGIINLVLVVPYAIMWIIKSYKKRNSVAVP